MRTTVGALKAALARVQKAVHTSAVTLQGLDGTLTVHASNGSQGSAKATMAVEDAVAFIAQVDGARLMAVLCGADPTSPCAIMDMQQAVRIRFIHADIRLPKMQADDVSLLEDSRWNGSTPIGEPLAGADLRAAFNRVTPFAARNDVRYYLNGVLMTQRGGFMTLVATDGFRLARLNTHMVVADVPEMIIPISIADALGSVLDANSDVAICTVGDDDCRGIGFRSEDFELICPVVAGKFPQFERVIPADADLESAFVSRKAALAVLERIGAVADACSGACYVRIRVDHDRFVVSTVSSTSRDQAELARAATTSMDMGFQPKLLIPAFAGVKSESVRIMYTRPADKSPKAVIRDSEDDSWCVVVMPSRS